MEIKVEKINDETARLTLSGKDHTELENDVYTFPRLGVKLDVANRQLIVGDQSYNVDYYETWGNMQESPLKQYIPRPKEYDAQYGECIMELVILHRTKVDYIPRCAWQLTIGDVIECYGKDATVINVKKSGFSIYDVILRMPDFKLETHVYTGATGVEVKKVKT